MNRIKQHPVMSAIGLIMIALLLWLTLSISQSVNKDNTLVDQINTDIIPYVAQLEIQLDEFSRSAEAENFEETLRRLDNIDSSITTIYDNMPHYQGDDNNLSQGLVSLDQAIVILQNTIPDMKNIIIKAQNKTITSEDEAKLDKITAQRDSAGELFDEAGIAFETYTNQ